MSLRERFEEKYIPVTESGCWIWMSDTAKNGYGHMFVEFKSKKKVAAHRLSYELYNGAIPDGMCVLHRCDVRNCVNPNHLFLGTYLDNHRDMVSKGRDSKPPILHGESHPKTTLTNDQVLLIRKDDRSSRLLGEIYGVSKTTILRIKRKETWSEL